MEVSYYPGCSLHGTAREYDESTREVSEALGVKLHELEDWNCCGASSAHSTDETLALRLAARNLVIAQRTGLDVVVPCAACFSRLKAAQKVEEEARGGTGAKGTLRVLSLLEFLAAPALREKIASRKKRSLEGLTVVCYYGCLWVRPPKWTEAKQPENPVALERLMKLLGARPIPWSYQTDCCGGSLVLTRTDIVRRLTGRLLDGALEAGAEAVVVACPLCQANLDTRQEEIARETGRAYGLPILYFTELIGLSFGSPQAHRWFRRHFVDPRGLLSAKGLL